MLSFFRVLGLTPEEQRAGALVELFIAAMNVIVMKAGDSIHCSSGYLHEYFPVFANELGLSDPLYEYLDSKCSAVSIYFDSKEGRILCWPCTHVLEAEQIPETIKRLGLPDKNFVLSAARRTAKRVIRPGWDWGV